MSIKRLKTDFLAGKKTKIVFYQEYNIVANTSWFDAGFTLATSIDKVDYKEVKSQITEQIAV